MSSFLKAHKVFDTNFNSSFYFESLSSEYAKSSLLTTINSNNTPIIFLLGEPGVGKTYMLNLIKDEISSDKKVLFTSEPFSTPESFLHFLLEDHKVDISLTISQLKNIAIEKFKNNNNIIMIDEAQLLNNIVLEFIRTLSDTGHFNFLLSMHKEDGEEILKRSHFLSRNHRVVILGILKMNEIQKYINSQLIKHSLGEISSQFKNKQIKLLLKLSNGNFRIIKQLLKHTFLIADYARTNGHSKYDTPNNCVITMAGIDLGIIDA